MAIRVTAGSPGIRAGRAFQATQGLVVYQATRVHQEFPVIQAPPAILVRAGSPATVDQVSAATVGSPDTLAVV